MKRIVDLGEDKIATSIIVATELRFGAAKKGSAALSERVDVLLSRFRVLPLETDADEIYGSIRADLESRGTPIGGNDLLIAAHALSLDRKSSQDEQWVLVTANVREFERVDGLAIENWL